MQNINFYENKIIKCADTKEVCVGYYQYLKSEHWKNIRAKTLSKKSKCENCNSKQALQLHHLTYRNLGNEKKADLIVLCEDCHMKLHKGVELKNHKAIAKAKQRTTKKKKTKDKARCVVFGQSKLLPEDTGSLAKEIKQFKARNKYK